MSVIETIYKDPKFYGACKKIAGQYADDLYQHVNLKILEKEIKGTFKYNKLHQYYYSIAKREFTSKTHSFRRLHFDRLDTTPLETEIENFIGADSNFFYTLADEYARTPSKSRSEWFVKEVYLECTKPDFISIVNLSNRTKITRPTLYGALHRFRTLFYDYLDTV